MRIKWYIFSFVLSLTLLGFLQQYEEPKANQEIVIQFSGSDASSSETTESLIAISGTLRQIGAKNITIVSTENGYFKIAYYSEIGTSKIEKILSEKAEITLENQSEQIPTKEKAYDFDVFQIEKSKTSSWDFEGQQVVTLNLKSDRSFQQKVFKFGFLTNQRKMYFDIKSKYNANTLVPFTTDNTSYNIPETRAGPKV